VELGTSALLKTHLGSHHWGELAGGKSGGKHGERKASIRGTATRLGVARSFLARVENNAAKKWGGGGGRHDVQRKPINFQWADQKRLNAPFFGTPVKGGGALRWK